MCYVFARSRNAQAGTVSPHCPRCGSYLLARPTGTEASGATNDVRKKYIDDVTEEIVDKKKSRIMERPAAAAHADVAGDEPEPSADDSPVYDKDGAMYTSGSLGGYRYLLHRGDRNTRFISWLKPNAWSAALAAIRAAESDA